MNTYVGRIFDGQNATKEFNDDTMPQFVFDVFNIDKYVVAV